MEMTSQSKSQAPIIETEIFDVALPSELLESSAPSTGKDVSQYTSGTSKTHSSIMSKSNSHNLDSTIQSHTIKGKSIFKQTPSYQNHQTISISLPTISIKFPPEGSGIGALWEKFLGYCKREMYISEGFMYVLERKGPIGYYVHKVWPLDDIFKIFYDKETSKVRLVFTVGHITQTKDFEIPERGEFFNRLTEQLNKIGRQI